MFDLHIQANFFQQSEYPLFYQLSGLFLENVLQELRLFRKSDQKKINENGFYPPLFRNSLESWQKSEYPLCKIIASQKQLPVTGCIISFHI